MVRDGALLIAAALAFLVCVGGWRWVAGEPVPGPRKLAAAAVFLLSGLALGIGFCGIVGLFAAHTDAYVWARGQDVQLQVPRVEDGGGTCRQVGSAVCGGTWDCDLSWTVGDDNEVDGIADVSSAELDHHGDTIPARALGSSAVSARLGRSLPDSQVVLDDIPAWGRAGGGEARDAAGLRRHRTVGQPAQGENLLKSQPTRRGPGGCRGPSLVTYGRLLQRKSRPKS